MHELPEITEQFLKAASGHNPVSLCDCNHFLLAFFGGVGGGVLCRTLLGLSLSTSSYAVSLHLAINHSRVNNLDGMPTGGKVDYSPLAPSVGKGTY